MSLASVAIIVAILVGILLGTRLFGFLVGA